MPELPDDAIRDRSNGVDRVRRLGTYERLAATKKLGTAPIAYRGLNYTAGVSRR